MIGLIELDDGQGLPKLGLVRVFLERLFQKLLGVLPTALGPQLIDAGEQQRDLRRRELPGARQRATYVRQIATVRRQLELLLKLGNRQRDPSVARLGLAFHAAEVFLDRQRNVASQQRCLGEHLAIGWRLGIDPQYLAVRFQRLVLASQGSVEMP